MTESRQILKWYPLPRSTRISLLSLTPVTWHASQLTSSHPYDNNIGLSYTRVYSIAHNA